MNDSLQTKTQILPFTEVMRFSGPISCANDRRRIELNAVFKALYGLSKNSGYMIEVTLSKEKLLQRDSEFNRKRRNSAIYYLFYKGVDFSLGGRFCILLHSL